MKYRGRADIVTQNRTRNYGHETSGTHMSGNDRNVANFEVIGLGPETTQSSPKTTRKLNTIQQRDDEEHWSALQ